MQLRVWHIARGVLSNWFAMAASLAVGFFLAPFILHRLGNVAYGVWILAVSSVNYLNLLDLGMRSSVLRFVSKGHTIRDHQGASDMLSAALWVRLQIGALVLILCSILAAVFPIVFKVPQALSRDAREAILVIGLTTAVNMSVGALGGVLSALNRYDLLGYITFVQLVVRVTGVVIVLRLGHGILAIAFCELLAAVIGNCLLAYISRRIYPELRISLKRPKPEVLRKIWSYSVYAFLLMVAGQLIYQTDNLVVGAFISASAVTFYSIGNSLCRYTQQIVSSMTMTFTPAASTYESAGDTESLRNLYYIGTRATMSVSLPIVITLLIRGRSFIGVWMGPQYSKISGTVLAILGTALLFSLTNTAASAISWGIEKHKPVAIWAFAEAIANLTLSIGLARKFGLYGVAVGTLIPSLIVHLILWPRYIHQIVNIRYFEVFKNVWGPVFLCAVPFAVGSYAVEYFYPTQNMVMFISQTLALLSIFGLAVGFMFRESLEREVLPQIRAYFYGHPTKHKQP